MCYLFGSDDRAAKAALKRYLASGGYVPEAIAA
jgi:hypothetical protein